MSRADPEHLRRASKDAAAWNRWRSENPDIVPQLGSADLCGFDLSGFDLVGAVMCGADLTDASLRKAKLENADLREAVLYRANLERADLGSADLTDADLLLVSGSGMICSDATAKGSRWAGAVVREAQLAGTDFRDADLREAEFHGSDLRRAKLAGAILWTTHLEDADLRNATGVIVDETIIRGTKFSPRSPDRWSVLRRYYTGPRYAITLIFLIAFVLPYLVKAAGWVAAARVQESLAEALASAESVAGDFTGEPGGRQTTAVLADLRDSLPGGTDDTWRSARVWELLLGVDKGPWYLIATLVLLTYNALRGLLTWVVGPMRDAEERSGVSPPHRVDATGLGNRIGAWLNGGWAESYAWLWLPHRIVTVLFIAAASSFAFHAINWLRLTVWLPT